MERKNLPQIKARMIEDAMRQFNAAKVEQLMTVLDWKWRGTSPNTYSITHMAARLCRETLENWTGDKNYHQRVSTGGIEAVIWWNELTVRFVAVEGTSHLTTVELMLDKEAQPKKRPVSDK